MNDIRDSADIGKIAMVGPGPAQGDGVTSFTGKLAAALVRNHPPTRIHIAAIGVQRPSWKRSLPHDPGNDQDGYIHVARSLNRLELGVDVVSLQYAHGRFGGSGEEGVLAFLKELALPLVTTLHGMPRAPSRQWFALIGDLLRWSDRVVVLRPEDREVLGVECGLDGGRIDVIPSGDGCSSIRGLVASQMSERTAAGNGTGETPAGPSVWEEIAEAYNRSFLAAIIEPRPSKAEKRSEPWPWTREHQFAHSEGWVPGWEA